MDDNKKIYIVRYGEVALKGQNKPYFEKMLVERIRRLVKRLGNVKVVRRDGLIFVYSDQATDEEALLKEMGKVFGIASISPAVEVASDMDKISEAACIYMDRLVKEQGITTFKVDAKRADKSFPVQSPGIAKHVGGAVLQHCKVLKVDVHNPQAYLFVDVRKDVTYLYQQKIKGFGGLPAGTNGKGLVLLSGGIDSPVAAWLMAKRGMLIEAVHFHSYPYTSERAQQKVENLAARLAVYCSRFKMHIVNLLPIQEELVRNCPEEEMTILVRRFMMKIAQQVAIDKGCDMLITGESLGQVASQTAQAIVVTDDSVTMPVMRPLIAMDKIDIIDLAKSIDTFDISIEPYEDCCTVFLPKHPVTKPRKERIISSEGKVEGETLIEAAIYNMETKEIYPK